MKVSLLVVEREVHKLEEVQVKQVGELAMVVAFLITTAVLEVAAIMVADKVQLMRHQLVEAVVLIFQDYQAVLIIPLD